LIICNDGGYLKVPTTLINPYYFCIRHDPEEVYWFEWVELFGKDVSLDVRLVLF